MLCYASVESSKSEVYIYTVAQHIITASKKFECPSVFSLFFVNSDSNFTLDTFKEIVNVFKSQNNTVKTNKEN